MNEVYEMSLGLHLSFAKVLLILLFVHLILIYVGNPENPSYIKRLRLFLPLYNATMALMFFTGALDLAILNFTLSFPVIWMICCFVALCILGVWGYKRMKIAARYRDFATFKKLMTLKIFCEIILVALAVAFGIKY